MQFDKLIISHNNGFADFVDYRGKHTLCVVGAERAVDDGKMINIRLGKHTEIHLNHLKI